MCRCVCVCARAPHFLSSEGRLTSLLALSGISASGTSPVHCQMMVAGCPSRGGTASVKITFPLAGIIPHSRLTEMAVSRLSPGPQRGMETSHR